MKLWTDIIPRVDCFMRLVSFWNRFSNAHADCEERGLDLVGERRR